MSVAPVLPNEPRLRVAEPDDIPGVLEVERASFASPWTERMFADEMKNDWSHFWVIETGPERHVAAFTVFWVAHDEIHVLNVAVAPELRRQGLARQLLESIVAFATARSASHIVLEVRPSNVAAQRLYQAFHFRPVGVRPHYYADNGEDAILMVRMIRG